MTHDDVEERLTGLFDDQAGTMRDSAPPTFSWEASTTGHHGPGRRFYIGAGVAAAVAAALVVTTVALPAHHASRSLHQAGAPAVHHYARPAHHAPASASALLLAAEHTRLDSGDPALQPGQYRYIRIVSQAAPVITYDASGKPHTTPPPAGSYGLDEYWIPKDETDVWMRRSSTPRDPAAGPDMVWKGRCDDLYADAQDGPKGPACTRPGSFDDPTPAFIASLPRDPGALYDELHSYSEQHLNPDKIHDVGFEMFTTIDSLLESGIIAGDLTSTLYGVLSRIPGIEVVQDDRNYSGVAGTGFRLSTELGQGSDADIDTRTIIVDPDSGAYLGSKDDSDGQHYSSAVTTGVSDGLGQPSS